jgi:hypothetical protein
MKADGLTASTAKAVLTTSNSKELLMATQAYHKRPTNGHMQRRHFELIAEIIAKELEGEHREKAAYAFSHILPMTNANFDPQRFLKACKVKAFCEVRQ